MHDTIPFLMLFGFLNLALFFAGLLGRLFRFPAILFYILAGITLGHIIHAEEAITAKKIWSVGLLDLFFNFFLVFGLMLLLGFDLFTSILAGGVAYASSSAITTKIIVDNHRIANPETELILGLMVFEDIAAPILLMRTYLPCSH